MVAPDKLTRGMVIDKELKAEIERRYNGWDDLRQQLAERETRLEEKTAECISFYNEAETVIKQRDEARQQLANSQKREVMLREALYNIKTYADSIDDADNWCEEALSATADLDGLILCHAEPVRYIYEYPYWDGSGVWRDKPSFNGVNANKSMPLYRAWEPTK